MLLPIWILYICDPGDVVFEGGSVSSLSNPGVTISPIIDRPFPFGQIDNNTK